MQQLFINCLVAIAALYKFTADIMFILLLLVLCCCQQNHLYLLYLWVFVWYGKNALLMCRIHRDIFIKLFHLNSLVPPKIQIPSLTDEQGQWGGKSYEIVRECLGWPAIEVFFSPSGFHWSIIHLCSCKVKFISIFLHPTDAKDTIKTANRNDKNVIPLCWVTVLVNIIISSKDLNRKSSYSLLEIFLTN